MMQSFSDLGLRGIVKRPYLHVYSHDRLVGILRPGVIGGQIVVDWDDTKISSSYAIAIWRYLIYNQLLEFPDIEERPEGHETTL